MSLSTNTGNLVTELFKRGR